MERKKRILVILSAQLEKRLDNAHLMSILIFACKEITPDCETANELPFQGLKIPLNSAQYSILVVPDHRAHLGLNVGNALL